MKRRLLSGLNIICTMGMLMACSNADAAKPASEPAGTTAAAAPSETAARTETSASVPAESTTVELGNATADTAVSMGYSGDLSKLPTFPYDTAEKKEYNVYEEVSVKTSSFDQMEKYDEANALILTFRENSVDITTGADVTDEEKETFISSVITMEGSRILITAPGTYILRGSLSDGQIRFRGNAEDKVQFVLDGVDLHCESSAPIYIENGDKALVTLAPDSSNTLSDAANAEEATKGCLYSEIDLSINGSGSLNISALHNNGISCRDDLKILNGDITISAENNAIKGNDSVSVFGGTLMLRCKNDGIKSDKEDDPEKGFLYLHKGDITIHADDDGLQAVTAVVIKENCVTDIQCYDDRINCDGIIVTPEN